MESAVCVFFGVDGQKRLVEYDLITRGARHPDAKEESRTTSASTNPPLGSSTTSSPLWPRVARAQFLFLKGIPTVHS